jgi:mono/diheme cytochrome c family protein
MAMLGVPYEQQALDGAPAMAQTQAVKLAKQLAIAGGPTGMSKKEVIALIAYMQRLGQDIKLEKLAEDEAFPVTSATSSCAGGTGTLSRLRAYLDGAELPAEPTAPQPTIDDALQARGAELFAKHCATCHGAKGDGSGPTGKLLSHPPAKFNLGTYELRTTEHEALPIDLDLFRTMSRGVHGTGMPAWFALPERDRWALVAELKTLSKEFKEDVPPLPIVAIAPAETAERLAHGKQIYETGGCSSCHGATGRGDGPASTALRYASGAPAKPRDFAGGRFHRTSRVEDIYRTIATGLDGTPMASFAKVLPPDDLWDVAMYVHSLAPKYEAKPDGVRCPPTNEGNSDELVGLRTLMQSLHPAP